MNGPLLSTTGMGSESGPVSVSGSVNVNKPLVSGSVNAPQQNCVI